MCGSCVLVSPCYECIPFIGRILFLTQTAKNYDLPE